MNPQDHDEGDFKCMFIIPFSSIIDDFHTEVFGSCQVPGGLCPSRDIPANVPPDDGKKVIGLFLSWSMSRIYLCQKCRAWSNLVSFILIYNE
jgi:hypothetical protein